MQIEQWLMISWSNLELDLSFAPDILSVECIYFVTWLQVIGIDFLLLEPDPVVFKSLLISLELSLAVFGRLINTRRSYHESNGTIHYFWFLKDPLAYVFTTIGALLAMDKAFADADFAKRVTADGRPTIDYVIHADGAIQLINTFATKC